MPLDPYLAEHNIAAQDVKYIWIDTQGFEPQIMFGMKNLLAEAPLPIFMEFNPLTWNQTGYFEPLMTFLAEKYSHFIHMEDGKETLYPLDVLTTIEPSNTQYGTRGDIFLIKAGAVVD